ncbi:DEAD/DEAH box helicase [Phototrophicus methaneseepsis]|uniref:RNA helicase n=1 Tax=Phototrophicus methaneseepsis TaxID=2710758 RepID=A0A7S8IFH3_9CHLR|nr:DEAD/DEAH box helicase [Phototrophicus methaneseepsis]QPC83489.1 DEAD/DEAH box helicase [Phototrophicus methaneseepsis]
MQFKDLNLIDPLLRAVREAGYDEPTPIQAQAIPHILAGKDLIGSAQTGTGKTAAFSLPILQLLYNKRVKNKQRPIRALILSPTRELSLQIGDNIATYGKFTRLRHTVIFGGVSQNRQVRDLERGVDVVVATPGRLLDLMQQGYVNLNEVEFFVLDEADRMLDMGFINDMRRVIKELPEKRQSLLFSATMPQEIQDLASQMLRNPIMVEVTPQSTTVDKIDQSVFFVNKNDKRDLLIHILRDDQSISRALVFTRTKHGADRLVQKLDQSRIRAEAIHGNKTQNARQKALSNFKAGKTRVLVATDIASRGIDVDDVTHVINFDLPNETESYVHRIGRTARAGAEGIAYSFCDASERQYLKDIEKLIRLSVPVIEDHPYAEAAQAAYEEARQLSANNSRNRNNRRRRSGGSRSQNGGNRQNSGGNDGRNRNRRSRNRSEQRSGNRASQPQSE